MGLLSVKWSQHDIERLVERWKPRLGLVHWTVEVRVEDELESGEDALMEIERHSNAHRAVLSIPVELTTGEFESRETIDERFVEGMVVHELAHCIVRDLVFVVRDDLQELFGQVAHELTMRNLHRLEERTVDQLARALVEHWPE